jgi:hypothetical protein
MNRTRDRSDSRCWNHGVGWCQLAMVGYLELGRSDVSLRISLNWSLVLPELAALARVRPTLLGARQRPT